MSLFRDEVPILGAGVLIDDPVTASNALPKLIGSWAESFQQGSATVPASQAMYIAPYAVQLISFSVRFGTAGGAAAAVTIEKTPSGTAVGSGTALLTGTVALTGTANTNTAGTLISTLGSLQLAKGDSLSLVFSGTLTGLAGFVASAVIQKI